MIKNYQSNAERDLLIGMNGLNTNKKKLSEQQNKLARKRKALLTESEGLAGVRLRAQLSLSVNNRGRLGYAEVSSIKRRGHHIDTRLG
jgi:hypothetical protein